MSRRIARATQLLRPTLFAAALALTGCPEGLFGSGGKAAESSSSSRATKSAKRPRVPAPPPPGPAAAAEPAAAAQALPEPQPEVDRAPEILGFAAASSALPARGTTNLEVELSQQDGAAPHVWWSATCGAVARDPESARRAIFVAPPSAGSCEVTVQVEHAGRTERREARITLAIYDGGGLGISDAPAASPPAMRRARPPLEPYYFEPPVAGEPPAPPATTAAAEPMAPALPDVAPPQPKVEPIAAEQAGPERWVVVAEDDFRRNLGAAVGGRWTEYALRRPGPSARLKAGDGDWVIRQGALSIWAMAESGPLEDFVSTSEAFAVDGSRVEFELRADLPVGAEAAVLGFWEANPDGLRSLSPAPGRIGLGWTTAGGRPALQVSAAGPVSVAAGAASPSTWLKHVITIRGDRMTWQVGDGPAVEAALSAPLEPGASRRFVFGIRAHTRQWHKVDVRGFRISRLERQR